MPASFEMIAKTFSGLENGLADELNELGAQSVQAGRRMVTFRGDQRTLMRANFHCRTAVRIMRPIAAFTATDDAALYNGVQLIDWSQHLDQDGSLAIDPVVRSTHFTNSLFAAQRAKDAIVDQMRTARGQRPSVDLDDPQLRINLHIAQDRVTVYLDASGDSLHRRGYRMSTGDAPINEVLAAGILRLIGWHGQTALADFMCGSGTFLIEAAMLARRIAPGLIRSRFGYMRWKDYDPALHRAIVDEAKQAVLPDLDVPLSGSDIDPQAIASAQANARRAKVADNITWQVANFAAAVPPAPEGILVTNPPYDERMKVASLEAVYQRLGDVLKQRWGGYTAWVFSGNLEAAKQIGLRAVRRVRLNNGPIECRLLEIPITARSGPARDAAPKSHQDQLDEQATAFGNRLARMSKHWHRWARRQKLSVYRIYDRDIPEIPLTIDWYDGRLLMVEHSRPHNRTEIEHDAWREQIVTLAAATLEVPREQVMLVAHRKSAPAHERPWAKPSTFEVSEAGVQYEVQWNRSGATGFELDQRQLRERVRAQAAGKRVLDLFAGSGCMTLAAAAGGAASVTAVESSPMLIEWMRRNLRHNALGDCKPRIVQEDPLAFAAQASEAGETYDLIVLRPPSFDGRRREGIWNVQDGHSELIEQLLSALAPDGELLLITTFRRLSFADERLPRAVAREITRQTIPPDCRDSKVHRAWRLVHRKD